MSEQDFDGSNCYFGTTNVINQQHRRSLQQDGEHLFRLAVCVNCLSIVSEDGLRADRWYCQCATTYLPIYILDLSCQMWCK